ncbi:MAG: heme-binding protein [Pseudomonadota bacterium]
MLTLELADRIASTALAEGERLGFNPLCAVVLDAGGNPLILKRDERASIGRPAIATGKAAGCLNLGVGGRTLATMAAERPAFVGSLSQLWPGGCVPVAGGVLVRSKAGALLGAVGVSGDVSPNDETCAVAGIEAAGLVADPGA